MKVQLLNILVNKASTLSRFAPLFLKHIYCGYVKMCMQVQRPIFIRSRCVSETMGQNPLYIVKFNFSFCWNIFNCIKIIMFLSIYNFLLFLVLRVTERASLHYGNLSIKRHNMTEILCYAALNTKQTYIYP